MFTLNITRRLAETLLKNDRGIFAHRRAGLAVIFLLFLFVCSAPAKKTGRTDVFCAGFEACVARGIEQENPARAEAYFSRALEIWQPALGADRRARVLLARGEARMGQGDFEAARGAALRKGRVIPGAAKALYRGCATDLAEAIQIMDKEKSMVTENVESDGAPPVPPPSVYARYLRAGCLRAAGQPKAALAEMGKILQSAPPDAGWLRQGRILFDLNRWAEAEMAFGKSLAATPEENQLAWRFRGITRLKLGKTAAAREDLRKALALDPKDTEVQALLEKLKQENSKSGN